MQSKTTIAAKLSAQNPEAFALLEKIMSRPGMYVGTNRFDYVEHFLSGYSMGHDFIEWLPNIELQYWLLHAHSASLHSGSLHGRSLFSRCFGVGKIAFENYKTFIASSAQVIQQQVHSEIYAYEEKNKTVRYDWEDDVPPDHEKNLAQTVLDGIHEMLRRTDMVCNKLKIYVRKEPVFCQVRFLFYGANGWTDDSKIIANPDNHSLLISIHANARNAKTDELKKCGCDVFDGQDYSDDGFFFTGKITDDMTFYMEHLRWKEKVKSETLE